MLFIKNQEIRGVDLEKADFNVIPVITVPDIDQPQAIDYDPDNDTLYWVDNSLKVINRANFNGDVETLIDKGTSASVGYNNINPFPHNDTF